MRLRSWALLPCVVGLSVAVELVAFDAGQDRPLAIADGVVGAAVLASAVVASDRRRDSLVGPLMGLAGLTWLAGTLWPGVRFLHRGPLVHLHLTYPTGRPRSPAVIATVTAVYIVSLLEPLADNDAVTLAVAAAVAAVATAEFATASGTARRAGAPALIAALALSGALSLGAFDRLGDWRAAQQTLWLYNVVVAGAVVLLLVDLLRGRWAESVVTGLVVDLGRQADSATLRTELARALGDPTLEVGYWRPSERRYADESGHPVDVADLPDGRVVTAIVRDGETVAVLVHDVAVLDDVVLIEAATAAARLAVDNARLQADTRERVDELAASRRRIVEAADEQRRRIGRELRDEVFSRLDRVADLIAEARRELPESEHRVVEIDDGLRSTRIDLDELSRGIHPLALTGGGLAAALPALADRAAIPVAIDVSVTRLPPTVEAALYFVCAEALANVAKHSDATHASLAVLVRDSVVVAVIEDDGCGGADPRQGTGLRGLADRVESLGGRLVVTSDADSGTRVEARIPLDAQ